MSSKLKKALNFIIPGLLAVTVLSLILLTVPIFPGPSVSFTPAAFSKDLKEMIDDADAIVIGEPTGKSHYVYPSRNKALRFIVSEIKVTQSIASELEPGTIIQLIQTEAFPYDPKLEKQGKYVMILEKYTGDFSGTQGAYVASQTYMGIYPIGADGEIYEYFTSEEAGKEETLIIAIDENAKLMKEFMNNHS